MDPEVDSAEDLLEQINMKIARKPAQTNHHRQIPVYWPSSAAKAVHLYIRKGKPSPLGPIYEGPFEILEKLEDACLRVRVGTFANGAPRVVTEHWSNCRPATVKAGTPMATRAKLGTCAVKLVLGETPKVPSDIAGEDSSKTMICQSYYTL